MCMRVYTHLILHTYTTTAGPYVFFPFFLLCFFNRFFKNNFRITEKLSKWYNIPMFPQTLPNTQYTLLLTSYINVVPLLQLMSQYLYTIIKQNP